MIFGSIMVTFDVTVWFTSSKSNCTHKALSECGWFVANYCSHATTQFMLTNLIRYGQVPKAFPSVAFSDNMKEQHLHQILLLPKRMRIILLKTNAKDHPLFVFPNCQDSVKRLGMCAQNSPSKHPSSRGGLSEHNYPK